jgi:ribonucleotide reductase beta subunit family protein with ferritin-like domain
MMNDDRSWDELSDAEKRFRMLIFDVYVMGFTFDLLNTHIEDATETMREFSRALSRTTRARGA